MVAEGEGKLRRQVDARLILAAIRGFSGLWTVECRSGWIHAHHLGPD